MSADSLLSQRADTMITKVENGDSLLALASELKPRPILLGDRFDPMFDTLIMVERLLTSNPSPRLIIMGISPMD